MDVLLKQLKANLSQRQKARGKSGDEVYPAPVSRTVHQLRFRNASGVPKDLEAPMPAKRVLREAVHGMMGGEEEDSMGEERALLNELEDGSMNLKGVIKELGAQSKASMEDDPLAGNIYRAWAYGLCTDCSWNTIGMVIIVIIQLTAPGAIAFTYYVDLDPSSDALQLNYPDRWDAFTADTWKGSLTSIAKTLMVITFLICMILNSISQNHSEAAEWTKSRLLFDGLNSKFAGVLPLTGKLWLYMGVLMNCSMLILLTACTFILMYFCASPVDVMLNILALMFIYRLDDADSAFGFFGSSDWDPDVMGKLADEIVIRDFDGMYSEGGECFQTNFESDPNNDETDGTFDAYFEEAGKQYLGLQDGVVGGTCCCYSLTSLLLYVFLIAFPLIYVGVRGIEPSKAAAGPTMEQFKDITAQLAKLTPTAAGQ